MKKILFVCTGNTCRSPMAMAVFNDIAKKMNIDAVAYSAGLCTQDGLPYSENSLLALSEENIALSGSSVMLNEDMVMNSHMIFGLTAAHGRAVMSEYPQYADKVYGFPCDIPDPFGGDLGQYKVCLSKIKEGVMAIAMYLKNGEHENEA